MIDPQAIEAAKQSIKAWEYYNAAPTSAPGGYVGHPTDEQCYAIARALLAAAPRLEFLESKNESLHEHTEKAESDLKALRQAVREALSYISGLQKPNDRLSDSAPGEEKWNEGYMVGWSKAAFCATVELKLATKPHMGESK